MPVALSHADDVAGTLDDAALAVAGADGRRVVDALHGLDRAAGRPGPRRESAWLEELRVAIDALDRAFAIRHHHSSSSDGLLQLVSRGRPSTRELVDDLQIAEDLVRAELHSMAHHLEARQAAGGVDVSDVRHRIARISGAVVHQRAREADLVYDLTGAMPARWTKRHDEPDPVPESRWLSSRERARVVERQRDHDRTAIALYGVEGAAGSPAAGRIDRWTQDLASALAELETAMLQEQTNGNKQESLLATLARTDARLHGRIRASRLRYEQVRDSVVRLRREMIDRDAEPDAADLRWQVASAHASLRYQQARRADLVYEALLPSP